MNNNKETNTLALLGFILSFFCGPVGSVLCYLGLEEIKKTGQPGKELATAGFIIGLVPVALTIIFLIIYILIFGFSLVAMLFSFLLAFAGLA